MKMGGGVDVHVEELTKWQSSDFKFQSGAASLSKCSFWQSSIEWVCWVVDMESNEVFL